MLVSGEPALNAAELREASGPENWWIFSPDGKAAGHLLTTCYYSYRTLQSGVGRKQIQGKVIDEGMKLKQRAHQVRRFMVLTKYTSCLVCKRALS